MNTEKLKLYKENKEDINNIEDYIVYFMPKSCNGVFSYIRTDNDEVQETDAKCGGMFGYCVECKNKFKKELDALRSKNE